MENNLIWKNTSETIGENPYLIKNMDNFLMFYVNQDVQFNGRYIGQKQRLKKLRNTLWIDPIEYLYWLYYKEQLDLRWIRDKLKNIGHTFPHETLRNMFKKSFKWKLRWNYDETPLKKIKDINKASINWTWWLSELNKNRVEETKKQVNEILQKSLWNNFNIEVYNKNKIKINKLSYIFYSFWIIKENTRENFIIFLKELNKNFWENRIVNIIKEIIEKLNLNIHIKIDSKEIWYWIKHKN